MSLKTCRECGASVSSSASSCPLCGAKPKKIRFFRIIFLTLIAVLAVKCSMDMNQPKKEKVLTEEDIAKEKKFRRAVVITQALKGSLHNPSSFELVSAIQMDDETLCITFRAKNQYNAIVARQIAVTKDGNEGNWSKYCAGKTGDDLRGLKYAIR